VANQLEAEHGRNSPSLDVWQKFLFSDVLGGCCRKRITDFTHWNHFLWIKILHPEAWMIHNNTNEMTRIDQNRLLQILLWSRFHGFPEAAGAAVRALAGPPCSQRCAAVSNSG
jgi:hypothetical protein